MGQSLQTAGVALEFSLLVLGVSLLCFPATRIWPFNLLLLVLLGIQYAMLLIVLGRSRLLQTDTEDRALRGWFGRSSLLNVASSLIGSIAAVLLMIGRYPVWPA
jgi:hypothetical protein